MNANTFSLFCPEKRALKCQVLRLRGLLKPGLGAVRLTRPSSGYIVCFLQTALPSSALNSYYLSAVIIHFITKWPETTRNVIHLRIHSPVFLYRV